jgi:hypothetical protein
MPPVLACAPELASVPLELAELVDPELATSTSELASCAPELEPSAPDEVLEEVLADEPPASSSVRAVNWVHAPPEPSKAKTTRKLLAIAVRRNGAPMQRRLAWSRSLEQRALS